ncbi:hypothetical protein CLOSTMETH_03164 [[Clostridium] methylpentosum DSM 5476]|uniref:Uncharacterized protein n=1 Tax=[Clostridium] methylpentosum DSM 5476 TaxID=537013 RepID=C0EH19_9FIRM|nr:hypothetical protein CLOSTMETH_03164 [[Clostridium] methylpentosum DSM 5476]
MLSSNSGLRPDYQNFLIVQYLYYTRRFSICKRENLNKFKILL